MASALGLPLAFRAISLREAEMNDKTRAVGHTLMAVLALWLSFEIGVWRGKVAAREYWAPALKEAWARTHSSKVVSLPPACEAGDFVYNLIDNKYYMCIA